MDSIAIKIWFLTSIVSIFFTFINHFYKNETGLERIFWGLFSLVIFSALCSLALVRLNNFDILNLAIINTFISTASIFIHPAITRKKIFDSRKDIFAALLLLLLAGLYALFPTYYIDGGRDYSLYLIQMAVISKTGGLNYDVPFMQQMLNQYGPELVRRFYGGIYNGLDYGYIKDTLIPQFLHLYGSWGAIFYSIAGVEGAVRSNGPIMLVGLFGLYLFTRKYLNPWVGIIIILVVGINPAMLFNARITTTEILSFSLLVGALIALDKGWTEDKKLWATAGGFLLALTQLNRIDGLLNILVIFGYFLVLLRDMRKTPIFLSLSLSYIFLIPFFFWDSYFHSYPYISEVWNPGIKPLLVLNAALILVIISSSILIAANKNISKLLQEAPHIALRVALYGLFAWFIFSATIWPNIDNFSFDSRSLRELVWYITPAGLVFSLIAIFHLNKKQRYIHWLPFVCIVAATTVAFTLRPSITPDHYWATRRWVPQVIPGLLTLSIIGGYYLFSATIKRKKETFVVLGTCLVAYLGICLDFSKQWLFVSQNKGLHEQFISLSHKLKETGSEGVIVKNDSMLSPLNYIYDFPAVGLAYTRISIFYPFTHPEQVYQALSDGTFAGRLMLPYNPIDFLEDALGSQEICYSFLERSIGRRSESISHQCDTYGFGIVPKKKQNDTWKISISTQNTSMYKKSDNVTRSDENGVRSKGTGGIFVFGPYINLSPGQYLIEWEGDIEESQSLTVGQTAVTANSGQTELASSSILKNDNRFKSQIKLNLQKEAKNVEFVIKDSPGSILTLKNIRLEKLNSQTEYLP